MVRGPSHPRRSGTGRAYRFQVLPPHREHGGHPLSGTAGDLARLARDAFHAPARAAWPATRDAIDRLRALRHTALPADLGAWAARLTTRDGTLPLLGAGTRAATYPALMWNGARCHRAGLGDVEALTLVGLAAGSPDASAGVVGRAVQAGLEVASALTVLRSQAPPVGVPTTGVVASAACAALMSGAKGEQLAEVIDLAATLMVITPASGAGEVQRSLWAGHCLAAGWLAPRLAGAGLVGMADSLAHTVRAVTGHPVAAVRSSDVHYPGVHHSGGLPPAGASEAAADVRIAVVLEGLA